MSGGEPSSIKRDRHVPRGSRFRGCIRRIVFYFLKVKETAECIRRYTASGGPKPSHEVVGQAHITDTLTDGRWPRAASPRLPVHRHPGHRQDHLRQNSGQGGELRASRWTATPCSQCDACRGIDSGMLLDVTELDAASNNGVDQVRALREEAVYTPAGAEKAGVHHRRGAHAVHRRPSTPC